MKKTKQSVLCFILIILGAIIFDQLTKGGLLYLLTGSVPLYGDAFTIIPFPYFVTEIASFFNIVFTWNPGTSFSLFRELGSASPYIITGMTAIIIGFLCYYLFYRVIEKREKIALSLIIGGAFGNFIDRLRFNAVIDFLDLHLYDWHWPAFNIADICICAGVGLYIIHWLFFGKKKKVK